MKWLQLTGRDIKNEMKYGTENLKGIYQDLAFVGIYAGLLMLEF